MISKKDDIRRITCADMTITQVIKGALTDNLVRIPFTGEGGFISTEIGESDDDDHIRISVTGFMNQSGQMLQTITVIYFDTISEARRFMLSPEGGRLTIWTKGRTTLNIPPTLETQDY